MTWSDAARKASAEARRRKAKGGKGSWRGNPVKPNTRIQSGSASQGRPRGTPEEQEAAATAKRNQGGNARRAAAAKRKYAPNSTASANARSKLNSAMARWR